MIHLFAIKKGSGFGAFFLFSVAASLST